LPLGYTTHGGVATHLGYGLHIHSNQQYLATKVCGSGSSLATCVTRTHHYNIIFWKHHYFN
jgi:hypothetical protein